MAEATLTGLILERASTAQQVATAVRDQLLRGDVAPGARLREEGIASALAVSRNTVREAMQILASEGLVRRSLHRGAIVSELSLEELADVYQARRIIELAGIRGAKDAGAPWLNVMRRILAEMQAAISGGSLGQLLEVDLRFHEAIVGLVASSRVSRFYRNVQTEIRLTRAWHGERPAPAVFYARHAEIVDALAARQWARAESLVAAVIDDGEARLRHGFEQHNGRAEQSGSKGGMPAPSATR